MASVYDDMLEEARRELLQARAERDALADTLREIEHLGTWSMVDHRGETLLLGDYMREVIRGKARTALAALEEEL